MKEKEMIFGIRAVIEAAEAGKDIDKVLVKRELSGELFKELQEVLRRYEIPMQKVPLERIDRITRKNHQGLWPLPRRLPIRSWIRSCRFCMSKGKPRL